MQGGLHLKERLGFFASAQHLDPVYLLKCFPDTVKGRALLRETCQFPTICLLNQSPPKHQAEWHQCLSLSQEEPQRHPEMTRGISSGACPWLSSFRSHPRPAAGLPLWAHLTDSCVSLSASNESGVKFPSLPSLDLTLSNIYDPVAAPASL